ncbi:MAG: MFS transporter, partial [Promethearchaeota archaeon]
MITEEQYQKGLSRILKDGYISQIMVILSTGPFLVAYILLLGGSLFTIGLIAAIPPLCQICQIFGIRIVEKVRNRRKLSVIFLSCYRICV